MAKREKHVTVQTSCLVTCVRTCLDCYKSNLYRKQLILYAA